MSRAGKIIKSIRKKIPTFKCIEGCTDCCGPVVFTKWEWSRIKDKRKATSIHCPYIGENGCDIYEDRPILCRLYGTVQGMECPKGCRPTKMLSDKKGKEIARTIHKITDLD